jgi:hypothetical protein
MLLRGHLVAMVLSRKAQKESDGNTHHHARFSTVDHTSSFIYTSIKEKRIEIIQINNNSSI